MILLLAFFASSLIASFYFDRGFLEFSKSNLKKAKPLQLFLLLSITDLIHSCARITKLSPVASCKIATKK